MSEKQSKAVLSFINRHIPDSIDKLVEDIGQKDAFTILSLRERLVAKLK